MYVEQNIIISNIWPITFFSCMLSLLAFFIIILLRVRHDNKKKLYKARKKEIEKQLIIHLASPFKDLKKFLVKSPSDMKLIAKLAPTILHKLKGQSYEKLLDSLREIGLDQWSIDGLSKKSVKDKIISINLAVYWNNKDIKNKLKELLKDKNDLVRFAAIEALAQTKDAQLLNDIVAQLKNSNSLSIPLISDIFQKFGNDAYKELSNYVKSNKLPLKIKIAAFMALIHTNEKTEIMKNALSLHNHKNKALRVIAYHALAKSEQKIDIDILQAGAIDNDWRIRQYVATCAGNNEVLPVEILTTLLKDENWLVGLRAAQVLYDSEFIGRRLLENIAKKSSTAASRAKMILAENVTSGGKYGLA